MKEALGDRDELLTITEVCEELKVDRKTLRNWRYRRTGPAWIGERRMIRYPRSEIERYKAQMKAAAPSVKSA